MSKKTEQITLMKETDKQTNREITDITTTDRKLKKLCNTPRQQFFDKRRRHLS